MTETEGVFLDLTPSTKFEDIEKLWGNGGAGAVFIGCWWGVEGGLRIQRQPHVKVTWSQVHLSRLKKKIMDDRSNEYNRYYSPLDFIVVCSTLRYVPLSKVPESTIATSGEKYEREVQELISGGVDFEWGWFSTLQQEMCREWTIFS